MPTTCIDIHELPARFDEALNLASSGTEVIVTDGEEPRARLIPLAADQPRPRVPGLHPGAIETTDDFDAALTDDFWYRPSRSEGEAEMIRQRVVRGVLYRPRMHCADIEALRDMLMFVQGVACGFRPPHGAVYLRDFGAFVNQKFGRPKEESWIRTLEEVFGPRVETSCESIARLFEEWSSLQERA